MTDMSIPPPSFTSASASGFYSPHCSVATSANSATVWMDAGKTCIVTLAFCLPHQVGTCRARGIPNLASPWGAAMRKSDAILPNDTGAFALHPAAPSSEPRPVDAGIESASSKNNSESDAELTLRQRLQRRMPPRNAIQAIIDRRRDLPDPWLDNKHD
jgi:hypothetical protein